MKFTSNTFLILDFDGVLMNSVDEALITAYNTATDLLVTSIGDLPTGFYKNFKERRSEAHNAKEMTALACRCLGIKEPSDPDIQKKYFEKRNLFYQKDKNTWLSLNKPHEPLWSYVSKLDKGSFVILSTKNKKAILELASFYGMTLSSERVFSSDDAPSKKENFNTIEKLYPSPHYFFVDDSIKNLLSLKSHSPKITCALASWGYVDEKAIKTAKENEIAVIGQEDLIEKANLGCKKNTSVV